MRKRSFIKLANKIKNTVLSLLVISFLFSSCQPTKHLKKDEFLLSKVKLKYKEQSLLKEELYSLSKQKPNRKLLGVFRLYLGVYNMYYHKEESKIRNNIGEAPVIFDSTLVQPSVELMSNYLNTRGYYENEVSASFDTIGKKKVKLNYLINAGKRYKINKVSAKIEDSEINRIYNETIQKTNIKSNEPFDIEILSKERKRIEKALKNRGYYKFTKEYVQFKADTSVAKREANLSTEILNDRRTGPSDSIYEVPHQTYNIKEVIVRIDYRNLRNSDQNIDTITVENLSFIFSGEPKVRPEVLAGLIYVRPNDLYRQDLQELTYRNLSGLRIFSLVSITYDQNFQNDNGLVAYIDLSLNKQKSYAIQSEGTNNGGNLGINANLNFSNKNTFRGAELLNIRIAGGLESQQILTDEGDQQAITGFFPFNTFEFGPEINLEVPRFLLPFKTTSLSQKGNPRTTFSTSFNIQQRPDYERNVSKTYISYAWNETPTKTHIIQPIDFSYIKLNPSAEFKALLEDIRNPFLRNTYTDNLILAARYSFILNTQSNSKLKNHFFFRGNVETAGNLLSTLEGPLNLPKNQEGFREISGIRYAQYLRTDIDFRFYQNFNENQMVYRITSGLGRPYGNSISLPFEKSFYAGGANGIRAWQARQLGPGNLPDSASLIVDQIGNMHLETNLEYRFGITNVIEGATFVDAGNIWNIDQKDTREDTDFRINSLWRGVAIGSGIGLRFNFTFFIFRLDWAVPVKDPGEIHPEEFKVQWKNSNLNFGIGYPF